MRLSDCIAMLRIIYETKKYFLVVFKGSYEVAIAALAMA
jgi:hypothetical protein